MSLLAKACPWRPSRYVSATRPQTIIAVYMLANRKTGTIYTGAATDLPNRIFEHREKARPGFTARYAVARLVWFQPFDMIADAFSRERTIKGWPRQWKVNLIETENPDWLDLYPTLI